MADYLNQKGIEKEMGEIGSQAVFRLSLAVKAPIKEASSNKGGWSGKENDLIIV